MRLYFFIFLLLPILSEAQTRFSFQVLDSTNQSPVIGALVLLSEYDINDFTDQQGQFTTLLNVGSAPDSVLVQVQAIGFKTYFSKLAIVESTILLEPLDFKLEEVVVVEETVADKIADVQMSLDKLSAKKAKLLPAFLGEVDVLKVLQLKPGINSGKEGNTGFYVRGSGVSQNLVLFDDFTLYNPYHLFGFFSTFNNDALQNVSLYKGGFPAQYSGRLASVIDVKGKKGSKDSIRVNGGLGLISSRISIDGPIKKDKLTFLVSARRTYADVFTRFLNTRIDSAENKIPDYFFYDINGRLDYTIDAKNTISLSGYFGNDNFINKDLFSIRLLWGNRGASLNWLHKPKENVTSNLSLSYSSYLYQFNNQFADFSANLNSSIDNVTLKWRVKRTFRDSLTLRYGADVKQLNFGVGRLSAGLENEDLLFESGNTFSGYNGNIFGAISGEWGNKWAYEAGVAFSAFLQEDTFYSGLEPRLSMVYKASEGTSFKFNATRMYQYIHLVANSGLSLPTDIWYPSTARTRPEISDQVGFAFNQKLDDNHLLSIETYYKRLYNQVDFKDFANLFVNNQLENEFIYGDGRAYGLEVLIERNYKRLSGWLAYSLAFTERFNFVNLETGESIENGELFYPNYDRRHDFSAVLLYELSKRLSVSGTFIFGSGDRAWLPQGRFSLNGQANTGNKSLVPVFGGRNGFRLPNYHRLDLSIVWKLKPKRGKSDITFSFFNAYNRRNVFFIFLDAEFQQLGESNSAISVPTSIEANQVSLFPTIPAITWNFYY